MEARPGGLSRELLVASILEFLADQDLLTRHHIQAALEQEIDRAGADALLALRERLLTDTGWDSTRTIRSFSVSITGLPTIFSRPGPNSAARTTCRRSSQGRSSSSQTICRTPTQTSSKSCCSDRAARGWRTA